MLVMVNVTLRSKAQRESHNATCVRPNARTHKHSGVQMKRTVIGRFKCAGCGDTQDVELEYPEQEPNLPEGWCALRGWWHETKPRVGESPATQDKVPLDVECCSYWCMENFLEGKLLRGDARTHKHTNELTPQVASEEKAC